ncbi:hypothetical protein Tco_1342825 [Tanacetum coccineum]
MTRWLTGGLAVVNGGPPPLTGGPAMVKRIENEAKTYEVRGGRTRQYEVMFRWWLDQSEHDTWHWRVSVRGVCVSVRGQACMDPCQSLAIMRRLVECKKSIIPLDPAISLDEDLKGRNCPSHLEAINGARISCIWGVRI